MPTLWGQDTKGEPVFTHTLKNNAGMEACISNYGAIIKSLRVPSPKLGLVDTVLTYPRLEQYLNDKHFLGAVCGRYCNRIANAEFNLNGQQYPILANDGGNQLHGGADGFYKRTWTIEAATDKYITLQLVSPDGDQGFPGELIVQVSYTLLDDNSLSFSWQAHSNKDTQVSLTNHAYFNLAGFGDISNHDLRIPCKYYTPINSNGIPTGQISTVDNTALDFMRTQNLKHVLGELAPELEATAGLDHNWTHNKPVQQQDVKSLTLLAALGCSESDIKLEVYSTLPGLQCYTGNHLASSVVFGSFEGICLESQFYPDSPNQPSFPSATLRAGATMRHETRFSFSTLSEGKAR